MSRPVLTTDRLILTPVAVTDFEDLKMIWGDEAFTRAITGRALTQEEVWFRLLRDLGHWQALGRGNWAMRSRETGVYVGSVGVLHYLRDLDPPFDAPELGWGVASAFQGQGLAREGLDAALTWADTVLKAPRTVCMISPDNGPSLRLAERVGYRTYGDGFYKDHIVHLLERPRPA
jgi:RimJ/RimL family protein N-acetyltransferase